MRHQVRMSTTFRNAKGRDEAKVTVFEVEDFGNLEAELKRQTQLIKAKYRIVDQQIVIRKLRTSYGD